MLEIGVNAKVGSERLGHSKVSITLDKYSHFSHKIQDFSAFQKLQDKSPWTNKCGHFVVI
ncbi:hypothetical protein E2R55_09245 [Vibrio vulnificus]|nr:hypothetical protein E2R55_09245 [Vibrio vulnificus]